MHIKAITLKGIYGMKVRIKHGSAEQERLRLLRVCSPFTVVMRLMTIYDRPRGRALMWKRQMLLERLLVTKEIVMG